MENNHLLIPLPLAELLFVTLGPLSEVMEREGHRWTSLVKMVLRSYIEGRDNVIAQTYGESMVRDIDIVTLAVSEELSRWVEGMQTEENDFIQWSKELGNGDAATGTDDK